MKLSNKIITGNWHGTMLLLLFFSYEMPIFAVPFIVTTTVDNGNNISPTVGSLRAAINAVNLGSNDAINFTIPTSDPGYNAIDNTWTIQPPVDLPNIQNTVTIDGYTQPGSSVNTLAQGDNAILTIILNGNNYTVGDGFTTGNGLHFAPLAQGSVDGSIVRGLVINQWLDNGILLDGTDATISNLSIIGCFIGTDASGMNEMANRVGIALSGTTNACLNTIIGTPAFADRNIIAGSFAANYSDSYGVSGGCISTISCNGSSIFNNYIGTDASGTFALGNSLMGISLAEESNSLIQSNIISGHTVFGLEFATCSEVVALNNFIGTDVTGTKPIGNLNSGIEFNNGYFGTPTGNSVINNLISGNGAGITIGDIGAPGAILNIIQGNKIGTDATGTVALANTYFGIACQEGQNTISDNVISGNTAGGIMFNGVFSAIENVIASNFIGTDRTGTKKIPNGGNGIQVGLNGGFGGARNNTIGA